MFRGAADADEAATGGTMGAPDARVVMSYQVLARKWRPQVFSELMGQEHVVRALTHALESGRIHHAFLFTGTRGVGKTTIARIFAKSLNCETGITATPCGVCSTCQDIVAGRFFDLLEIDAASNTGVDDVRSLIENAQYAPARGRMKVYLIDEVHMLSKNAFNALLKTLEEPPDHVKFLLATTDPQKLPITVLSRCLQFNLKRLSIEQIETQVERILQAEHIEHDSGSVREIARSGNGSLRDALSLLDQAIAFGAGSLRVDDVQSMLGTMDRSGVTELLTAVIDGDGDALARRLAVVSEFQPDFGQVLEALAEFLHGIQVAQLMPNAAIEDAWPIKSLMDRVAPETVQLLYQLAITGRRDLDLAPSARIGFEMCLLRMLAFQPRPPQGERAAIPAATDATSVAPSSPRARSTSNDSGPVTTATARRLDDRPAMADAKARPLRTIGAAPLVALVPDIVEPLAAEAPAATDALRIQGKLDALIWAGFPEASGLRGPSKEFAANLAFIADEGAQIRFALAERFKNLINELGQRALRDALTRALGRDVNVQIDLQTDAMETPASLAAQRRSDQQIEAERIIEQDPFVQRAIAELGAGILAGSSKPIESTEVRKK